MALLFDEYAVEVDEAARFGVAHDQDLLVVVKLGDGGFKVFYVQNNATSNTIFLVPKPSTMSVSTSNDKSRS